MPYIKLNAFQIGIVLSIGCFIFQIIQSAAISRMLSSSFIIWTIPLIMGITFTMCCWAFFSIENSKKLGKSESEHPAQQLASAILVYALQLANDGRDVALIKLRNKFTDTLHIMGFHNSRVKLGEIALKASVLIKDYETKVDILIDDLGWAYFLLDKEEIAKQNIIRGINISKKLIKETGDKSQKLHLSQAKGYRHLACISRDAEKSNSYLQDAQDLLESILDQTIEVRRDIAQIHHAKALTVAMSLNIHKSGKIRLKSQNLLDAVQEALENVRQSAFIFREIGDLDRYTKSLFLEVRLLEATDENTEAVEVAALRDRTLAASEWILSIGTDTITGK